MYLIVIHEFIFVYRMYSTITITTTTTDTNTIHQAHHISTIILNERKACALYHNNISTNIITYHRHFHLIQKTVHTSVTNTPTITHIICANAIWYLVLLGRNFVVCECVCVFVSTQNLHDYHRKMKQL